MFTRGLLNPNSGQRTIRQKLMNNFKWNPGKSELELEDQMRQFIPRSAKKKQILRKYMDIQIKENEEDFNNLSESKKEALVKEYNYITKEEADPENAEDLDRLRVWWAKKRKATLFAWSFLNVQMKLNDMQASIDEQFIVGFWKWLMGAGTEEEVSKTPWGRDAPYWDTEVKEYIMNIVNGYFDFRDAMYRLAVQGEMHMISGIDKYALYYKHIVHGNGAEKKGGEEFLDDFMDGFLEAKRLRMEALELWGNSEREASEHRQLVAKDTQWDPQQNVEAQGLRITAPLAVATGFYDRDLYMGSAKPVEAFTENLSFMSETDTYLGSHGNYVLTWSFGNKSYSINRMSPGEYQWWIQHTAAEIVAAEEEEQEEQSEGHASDESAPERPGDDQLIDRRQERRIIPISEDPVSEADSASDGGVQSPQKRQQEAEAIQPPQTDRVTEFNENKTDDEEANLAELDRLLSSMPASNKPPLKRPAPADLPIPKPTMTQPDDKEIEQKEAQETTPESPFPIDYNLATPAQTKTARIPGPQTVEKNFVTAVNQLSETSEENPPITNNTNVMAPEPEQPSPPSSPTKIIPSSDSQATQILATPKASQAKNFFDTPPAQKNKPPLKEPIKIPLNRKLLLVEKTPEKSPDKTQVYVSTPGTPQQGSQAAPIQEYFAPSPLVQKVMVSTQEKIVFHHMKDMLHGFGEIEKQVFDLDQELEQRKEKVYQENDSYFARTKILNGLRDEYFQKIQAKLNELFNLKDQFIDIMSTKIDHTNFPNLGLIGEAGLSMVWQNPRIATDNTERLWVEQGDSLVTAFWERIRDKDHPNPFNLAEGKGIKVVYRMMSYINMVLERNPELFKDDDVIKFTVPKVINLLRAKHITEDVNPEDISEQATDSIKRKLVSDVITKLIGALNSKDLFNTTYIFNGAVKALSDINFTSLMINNNYLYAGMPRNAVYARFFAAQFKFWLSTYLARNYYGQMFGINEK